MEGFISITRLIHEFLLLPCSYHEFYLCFLDLMNKLGLKCLFFLGLLVGLIKDIAYLSMPILPTPPSHDSGKLWDTTSLPHKMSSCGSNLCPPPYEAAALWLHPACLGTDTAFQSGTLSHLSLQLGAQHTHLNKTGFETPGRGLQLNDYSFDVTCRTCLVFLMHMSVKYFIKVKDFMETSLLGIKTSCQGELRSKVLPTQDILYI